MAAEDRQKSGGSSGSYVPVSSEDAKELGGKLENPLYQMPFFTVETLDQWYDVFTWKNTGIFVLKETWHVMVFYSLYSGIVTVLAQYYPENFEMFQAGSILKVLAFMTGLLISFVLKESLERYRKCVAAMVDFTDEFKALWYMSQQPLLRKSAPAKIIVDMHMVLFAVSLVRFLMKKADIDLPDPDLMVQKEFRECAMFKDQDIYGAACSNPAYSELLMVSWLRCCGILNGELRKHIEWMRVKLRALITEQRTKSPGTSRHLLTVVTHMFLMWIPWCVEHNMSRIFLPLIAVVLFSLLKLAHELEDPFGVDRHDLPWPVMLANVAHCTLCQESRSYLKETVATFNHACLYDKWINPEELFGHNYVAKEDMTGNKFDTGKMHLNLYLTLPKLKSMEVVASEAEREPDCLFSAENMRGLPQLAMQPDMLRERSTSRPEAEDRPGSDRQKTAPVKRDPSDLNAPLQRDISFEVPPGDVQRVQQLEARGAPGPQSFESPLAARACRVDSCLIS